MKNNSNQEVKILVNNKPIREYYHNNKVYIQGIQGAEYQIKIKNNGPNRVLCATTI